MQSSNKLAAFKPETSQPYYSYIKETKQAENKNLKNNIYLNVGVLSEVKGSAYMEYEETKVLTVIFPPQEPTKSSNVDATKSSIVQVDVSIPAFASRDKLRIQNQKSLAIVLKKALEPIIKIEEFSTFKVCIYIVILEYTQHTESTAFNCCIAALAEAGIPLFDLYASCSLNISDLAHQNKMNVYSKDLARNQITNCFQKGYMTLEEFKKYLNENLEKNEKMLNLIRAVLINKIKK